MIDLPRLTPGGVFHTERLILRPWGEADVEPFARMSADAEVMRYFPHTLNRAASEQFVRREQNQLDELGWGWWALERQDTQEFIGFVGLKPQEFTVGEPFIEIGWRLDRAHWQQGYATEAAQRALRVGFVDLKLDAIHSMTAVLNTPSQRLMQRLGMQNTGKNFAHPRVAADSPLREHVLYRLERADWQRRVQA